MASPPISELDPAQPVPAPAVPQGAERGGGQVLLVDAQPREETRRKTKTQSNQVKPLKTFEKHLNADLRKSKHFKTKTVESFLLLFKVTFKDTGQPGKAFICCCC